MFNRLRDAVLAGAILAGLATPAAAQDTVDVDMRISGYYKNLLQRSETWSGEGYTLDVNRLRLELKGKLGSAIRFDLQYDNEVLLGSYLRTAQFQQQKTLAPPQYWSAQANYLDNSSLYGVHRLYRAQLQAVWGDTEIRLGRQRIAWGTGRFWSPLDLLNPVSPVALEREERPGVDALLIERRFGPVGRVAAVYAPSHRSQGASRALQWHDNALGMDYSVTAGRFGLDQVVGVDLAGQIGAAGWRAELTRVRPRQGEAFSRSLIGVDYAFANTLTLSAEYYRDGSGALTPAAYDFSALLTGSRQTLAQRYLGLHAGYAFTPLIKLDTDFVLNLADRSSVISPVISYSIQSNLDLSLGLQWFWGAGGSEYGGQPGTIYAGLQWYF
ncbi:MAG: hypothetical protein ACYCZ6_05305 [Polaromonas sp.]